MKKITWDTVLKVVIALASALLGALGAHAMTGRV
ncbi:smalltalk protein [Bacteroides timonensis]|nr:smalltalk protein [Bacteroides timonensis]